MRCIMSEYIMGLGISVKICKIYEKIIYLELIEESNTKEYFEYVNELKNSIEDETKTYDKLDIIELDRYYKRVTEEDITKFDAVKSRYHSKLKERIELLDSSILDEYPFTLDTAIYGKILMDALVNVEKQFKELEKNNELINNPAVDLYSFHKTYKYTIIASNDFLERIAVNFKFNLSKMPNISFEKIRNNFEYDNTFYNKLNQNLYLIAIDTINTIINSKINFDVGHLYSNLLFISQLEVIISYLDKKSLQRLLIYCKNNKIENKNNGKYINNILKKNY